MCIYPFHIAKNSFNTSDALVVLNHLGRAVGTASSAKQAQEILAEAGLKNARASMRKVSGNVVFADSRCDFRVNSLSLSLH